MRDITHYFKSPSSENENKCNIENSTEENNQNDKEIEDKSKNDEKLSKKRKRRRRKDEIAVATSSNTSTPGMTSEIEVESKKRNKKYSKLSLSTKSNHTDEIVESTSNNDKKSNQKLNAFQFMMDSRNKIIGRNSPGKILDNTCKTPEITSETKEKLKKHKLFLQNWSDNKGGLKCKEIEDENDEIIKIKLNKRRKRLKNMLTKNYYSDDDFNDRINKKCKKRIKIVSDNENNCELVDIKTNKTNLLSFVDVLNKKKVNSTKNKKWKMRVKLLLDDDCEDVNNEDDVAAKARKNFLYTSEVPILLKRRIEKNNSYAEANLFPSISHVQQKQPYTQHKIDFWNLPEVNLNFYKTPNQHLFPITTGLITTIHTKTNEKPLHKQITTVNYYRNVLQLIKEDNPIFPVYKVFKLLRERNKTKKINRLMWSDKYKPYSADEIFSNTKTAQELKQWLKSWLQYKDEMFKNKNDSSSSDFESNDSTSFVSLKNTMILQGPHGSGKTTCVYGVCNELSIKVLEVNASSKRTGKYLLQKLQESTQSHQVNKSELNIKNDCNEMCLLLIEDVDIVFEQDEGFVSALLQIMNSSKRPIILTTTHNKNQHLQRFFAQYPLSINTSPAIAQEFAVWLQIVCLNEGFYVHKQALGELLEFNKGDVRATLLQLQFWLQSGGQLRKTQQLHKIDFKKSLSGTCKDLIDFSWLEEDEIDYIPFTHCDCISSFVLNTDKLPYPLDLQLFWWNMPMFYKFSMLKQKTNENANKCKTNENVNKCKTNENVNKCKTNDGLKKCKTNDGLNNCKTNEKEMMKLDCLNKNYDAITLIDTAYKKIHLFGYETYSSVELNSSMENYSQDKELVLDWSHEFMQGCVNLFETNEQFNFSLPSEKEKKWLKKQKSLVNTFLEGVPLTYYTSINIVSTDYMSILRSMSRSEFSRYSNNNKRRFLNYLRGLGINVNNTVLKNACKTLCNKYKNL